MPNFGHSKFLPVFLHLKGLNKFRMLIFGHSKFLPVFLYQKGLNKFGMHIFGHSEFIPVFLGKIVRKNSEQPFLAILNLYQSSWEKLLEKILGWPFLAILNLYQSSWEKLLEKTLGWPFLAILNLYQSSWEKLLEKNLGWPFLAILNWYQFFWKKNWNGHFWPFQIYSSLFGRNCWKKFRTAICGHPKFVPVLLGKIVKKNSEWLFLAIPNLYQSFWGKLLEKIWNSHFWPF